MSRARVGDVLCCEVCGLKVAVSEECGCATIDIICCEEPMVNLGPEKQKKPQTPSSHKKKSIPKKNQKTPQKAPPKKPKKEAKKTLKKSAKKK